MRSTVRAAATPLIVLLLALATVLMTGPGPAHAQSGAGISQIAAALRADPVYVDPGAADIIPPATAEQLRTTIRDSGKPVFAVAVPADSPLASSSRQAVLTGLRQEVGRPGVYAVSVGRTFDAAADSSVMSAGSVATLKADSLAAHQGDGPGLFTSFVDGAVAQAGTPAAVGGDNGGPSGNWAGAVVLGGVIVAGTGLALYARRARRRRRAEQDRRDLELVRPAVDEDITAYGEGLDAVAFDPGAAGADDAMRADYEHALDAYDRAKAALAAATGPEDVERVSAALDDGRFALATLAARRAGEPLPERRPPCFFDPRHGQSVADVSWAPRDGTPREVPVCAADQARLADGEEPMSREVATPYGRRPYWEAGPAYAPWASGWYGSYAGMLMPALFVGTVLGSSWGHGYDQDLTSGSDFLGGDAGSGGFGGWGGGDFGGGGWGGGDGGGF